MAGMPLLATDMGPGFELPEGITNEARDADCLIAPDSTHSVGRVLVGTNGFSGKPQYLIGFVLPDERAAAVQAFSAVPAEYNLLWTLASAQYMSIPDMANLDWQRPGSPLHRRQLELVVPDGDQMASTYCAALLGARGRC